MATSNYDPLDGAIRTSGRELRQLETVAIPGLGPLLLVGGGT